MSSGSHNNRPNRDGRGRGQQSYDSTYQQYSNATFQSGNPNQQYGNAAPLPYNTFAGNAQSFGGGSQQHGHAQSYRYPAQPYSTDQHSGFHPGGAPPGYGASLQHNASLQPWDYSSTTSHHNFGNPSQHGHYYPQFSAHGHLPQPSHQSNDYQGTASYQTSHGGPAPFQRQHDYGQPQAHYADPYGAATIQPDYCRMSNLQLQDPGEPVYRQASSGHANEPHRALSGGLSTSSFNPGASEFNPLRQPSNASIGYPYGSGALGYGQPVQSVSASNQTAAPSTNPANALTNSDTTSALAAVEAHAQALTVPTGNASNASDLKALVQQTKEQYGLRTGFANQGRSSTVITNHLTLTTPKQLHVYRIDMIRTNFGQENEVKVKRFADKQTIFENVRLSHFTQLTNSRGPWATDFDLLWSLNPLFGLHDNAPTSPLPAPAGSYNNECGVRLQYQAVRIEYQYTIDCTRPTSELFHDRQGGTDRDSQPAVYLRGLNAFLTAYARQQTGACTFPTGKKAFRHADAKRLITPLQALKSFFISARPGLKDVFVNIKPATSAFFEQLTVQEIIVGLGVSTRQASGILKGTKVRITSALRVGQAQLDSDTSRRSIVKIGRKINEEVWPQQNGVSVGAWYSKGPQDHELSPVRQHTRKAYANDRATYAVCVAKDSLENSPTMQWIAADALKIEDYQRFAGALSGQQVSAMISTARLQPDENCQRIVGIGLPLFGFDRPQQTGLTPAGLAVGTQLLQIPGRILSSPQIRYLPPLTPTGSPAPSTSDDGQMNMEATQASWTLQKGAGNSAKFVRFAEPSQLTALPFLDLADDSNVRDITRILGIALRNHGLISGEDVNFTQINTHQHDRIPIHVGPDYEQIVSRCLNRLDVEQKSATILVLLRKKDQKKYSFIKRVAELQLGIRTVFCITQRGPKARVFDLESGANISLKYNLKGEGRNHYLADSAFKPLRISAPDGKDLDTDTIVLGADVTHPGKGAMEGTPSIAAVVGSTDAQFMHYPGSMRLQRSRKEEITELGDMVKERLIDWAEKHEDRLPQRVLFYRDGVSESQYAKIRSYEIPQIQKAFNWAQEYLHWKMAGNTGMLDSRRNPWPSSRKDRDDNEIYDDSTGLHVQFKLTYVIVGKRHNTRFYPLDDQPRTKSGNVTPGLVVDQVITHPLSCSISTSSRTTLSRALAGQLTTLSCRTRWLSVRRTSSKSLCDRGRNYLDHWLHPTQDTDQSPPRLRNTQSNPPETHQHYNDMVKGWLRDQDHWSPATNRQLPLTKYGFARRNPWHPALDNIMFYL